MPRVCRTQECLEDQHAGDSPEQYPDSFIEQYRRSGLGEKGGRHVHGESQRQEPVRNVRDQVGERRSRGETPREGQASPEVYQAEDTCQAEDLQAQPGVGPVRCGHRKQGPARQQHPEEHHGQEQRDHQCQRMSAAAGPGRIDQLPGNRVRTGRLQHPDRSDERQHRQPRLDHQCSGPGEPPSAAEALSEQQQQEGRDDRHEDTAGPGPQLQAGGLAVPVLRRDRAHSLQRLGIHRLDISKQEAQDRERAHGMRDQACNDRPDRRNRHQEGYQHAPFVPGAYGAPQPGAPARQHRPEQRARTPGSQPDQIRETSAVECEQYQEPEEAEADPAPPQGAHGCRRSHGRPTDHSAGAKKVRAVHFQRPGSHQAPGGRPEPGGGQDARDLRRPGRDGQLQAPHLPFQRYSGDKHQGGSQHVAEQVRAQNADASNAHQWPGNECAGRCDVGPPAAAGPVGILAVTVPRIQKSTTNPSVTGAPRSTGNTRGVDPRRRDGLAS